MNIIDKLKLVLKYTMYPESNSLIHDAIDYITMLEQSISVLNARPWCSIGNVVGDIYKPPTQLNVPKGLAKITKDWFDVRNPIAPPVNTAPEGEPLKPKEWYNVGPMPTPTQAPSEDSPEKIIADTVRSLG